ncbi:MAG: hypothetical protein WCR36_06240 [Bacteroidaceae bacterium]
MKHLIFKTMEKINLTDFQQSALEVNEMLQTAGGSSESSGTVHCQTKSGGGDSDHRTCDEDW